MKKLKEVVWHAQDSLEADHGILAMCGKKTLVTTMNLAAVNCPGCLKALREGWRKVSAKARNDEDARMNVLFEAWLDSREKPGNYLEKMMRAGEVRMLRRLEGVFISDIKHAKSKQGHFSTNFGRDAWKNQTEGRRMALATVQDALTSLGETPKGDAP